MPLIAQKLKINFYGRQKLKLKKVFKILLNGT